MSSRTAFATISALLALATAGCGGGNSFTASGAGDAGGTASVGGAGGGGAGTGPALSEIPSIFAQAMCSAVTGCSTSAAGLFLGANDCATLVAAQIKNGSLPGFQAAVDAGTLKYDPSAVQGCLDAISNGGCLYSNNPYIAACELALGGTVDEGGACAIDEECKGDLYCKYGGTCPGTCSLREQQDSLCRTNKDCQSGLTCFVTTGTTGRCTVKPTLGQGCGYDVPSECSPQSGDAVICWGASSTKEGQCVAVNAIASQGIGNDCSVLASSLCVSGATCALASIALNGTCVDVSSSATSCTFSFPDPCDKEQYCTATAPNTPGTCSLLPTANQPCVTGIIAQFSNKVCAPDHVCVTTAAPSTGGTCVKYRQNGEACSGDKVCYSGRCDSQSQQCVPNQNCTPGAQ